MNLQFQQRIWLSAAASAAAADNRIADQQALTAAAADTAAQLGGQLSAVWGPDLGTSVADRLRAQTDALVGAAAGGNRSQSAADIDRLRTEIDGLLAGANPLLPPGLLAQQLRASDQQLLVGTDAYIGRDFSAAYSRVRDAARQIQKVADTLSLSIVDRFPGRYLVLPTPYPSMP